MIVQTLQMLQLEGGGEGWGEEVSGDKGYIKAEIQ